MLASHAFPMLFASLTHELNQVESLLPISEVPRSETGIWSISVGNVLEQVQSAHMEAHKHT